MNIKSFLGPTAVALGLSLVMHCEGRAAEVSNLKLSHDMVIAGVRLRAGAYGVEWKVQGTRATVIFSREGRRVATVGGECVAFDRSVTTSTLYFSKNADGSFAINALGFAGTSKGVLFPLLRSHAQPSADVQMNNRLESPWWGGNAVAVPRLHK